MEKKIILSIAACLLTFISGFYSNQTIADDKQVKNPNILIQEGNLSVTREEALQMIEEMTWEQKQRLLNDENKFQSILLDYFRLKKHELAAKKKELDKKELIKWKIKKQTAQLLSRELINDFRENVDVPKSIELVARNYYDANPEKYKISEKVSASHILLATKKDDSKEKLNQTLKRANEIIKEIKNGLEFEKAAKKYSDDKGSASNGGNLNFFPRGQMVTPFEKAAFSLKEIGEISPPIKTRFGYHIIKLTGRIEASKTPFDEVKHSLIKKEKEKYLKIKTDEFLSKFNATKNTNVFLPTLQKIIKEESAKLNYPLNKTK